MLALAGGYAMWVLPFQFYGTPAWRTRNIATAWAFMALGVAMLVNTAACMVDRWPVVLRRTGVSMRIKPRTTEGSVVRSPLPPDEARDLCAGALGGTQDSTSVARVRGRFGPLGTEVFHLALTLLAVALALNAGGIFRGKVVLVEGESFSGRDRASYAEPVPAELASLPDSALPDTTIRLVKVTTSFWKDVQLFNRLEARVAVGAEERREVLTISSPMVVDGASIAVDGFGYAPQLHLVGPDGRTADQFLKLKVFPPGSFDEFDIPDTPYRLRLAVYPDASKEGTGVANASYNLVRPLILARVEDPLQSAGDEPAFQGMLRPGEKAEFLGYTLSFPSIRYYAELRVIRNPGAAWFMAAALLATGGLILRYGARRREVLVIVTAHGSGSELRVHTAAEGWGRSHRARAVERVRRAVDGQVVSAEREGGEDRG